VFLSCEYAGLSSSARISHIACYWKFFLVHYTQALCQYRLCRADRVYLTYFMLQRQLSHLNGRKLDHSQVQASYIVCIWLCLVLYHEHVHSHDFVWLLLVASTILLYNRIHTEGWKPCANRGPVYTLENSQWCREPCFVGAAILRDRCPLLISRRGKRKSLPMWWSALWRVSLMLARKRSFWIGSRF
jgi:hypothetical protein